MRYIPVISVLAAVLFCGLCIQPVLAISADEWVNSGDQLNQQGRYQEALQAFENAISLDSRNQYAWSGKGTALQNLNRLQESLDAYNQALAIDSSNPWSWSGKSGVLNQMGRSVEALSAAEKALALDTGRADFWNSKGYALLSLGRYQESLDAFNQALTIDSGRADSWNFKGTALQNLNRLQESLDAYNKALSIDSGNQWSWSAKSNVLNQMGRYAEALIAVEQALAIDPTNANIWVGKGSALQSLNRLQESLDSFNQALAIDSSNQWSWSAKSNVLNQMGRYAEALSAAEQALALDSGRAEHWNSKGYALMSLNRLQESLDAFNNALVIDSGNQWSWGGKSNVLNQMGRYAEALSAAEQALVIDSGRAEHWNSKGWALLSLGRYQESLDAFNAGLVRDANNQNSQNGRQEALSKIGTGPGSTISVTPVPTPLSVTVISTPKIQSTPPSSSPSNGGDTIAIVMVNEPISRKNTNSVNGVPMAGYVSELVKWNGISWETSPVLGSGITDSTGVVQITFTEKYPGTFKYKFHIGQAWSNLMGVKVLAYPVASFDAAPTSGSSPLTVTFTDASTGDKISSRIWEYKLNSSDSTWTPITLDGASSFTFTKAGSYDVKLTVTGTGGSDDEVKMNYINPIPTGTPVPAQLSVTDVSTPGIQSTSPSPSPSNGGDSNVTSAVSTPGIESILRSLPLLKSVYPKLSLPIIVILMMLFLVGGGYMIYRMKKKPSGCKPPERKEKKAIAPHPASTGSTTKPELTLTLDRTRLFADNWDRITIQIVNRGNADAKDIRLTLSDEFDTKWIKPAMINAGAMTSLDIGIRPKVKGKIPLEVTALYHDVYDKEYRETHEFWIEVVEKGKATSPPSETPKSPVSQFTPRPLTPKQLPPDLSDRYTESEFIGKGGFARVFKAKRKDGKYVAVKIPISMDAMTGKSFIAEMQNWTKLSHPNIVRLYDFNIMPLPYFEEELCDSALADQNKPIECEKAAWILFNICEGLKFAHTRKIIHRDLKPQNILLKNGVPKISDWGLSRIVSESTTTTITSFTPHYAAPEQINGRVKDERTDIWQLGVILYELVTGILPFNGDSMVEIGMNIATKDPKCPSEIIPDAKVIDRVVMKCLQKDPAKRYQCVLEFQKDLALYLRENYTELLKTSVTAKDYNRSVYYCGDLLMINLVTGDLPTSYKYVLDLVHYSKGDMKVEAQELCEQIKMRMEMGVTEIPDELIQKAEILVHQLSVGFRNRE